jgi:glutamate--cysteine ligase
MDFAESQLELVTRPRPSLAEVVGELGELTRAAMVGIGEEVLWPFSMPPRLPHDDGIRLAHPGVGESARSAERYRNGLALRYGVSRQMICGVHVNVSMGPALLATLSSAAPLSSEEAKERTVSASYYLRLVRNLVDDLATLVFFFGASPVRGGSAAAGVGAAPEKPAVSLRNSPLGYARGEYRPFFDLSSIAAHAAGIRRGLRTESASFRKIPLVREGKVLQLNGRVFQKEKEFYAPIRFRSTPKPGETPLAALEKRGVEYLELRIFDVDPFTPSGVSSDALMLLQLLILDSLSRVSAPRTNGEWAERLAVADEAAMSDPFSLAADSPLRTSAARRLDALLPLAAALDAGEAHAEESSGAGLSAGHMRTLEAYRRQVDDPTLSASARLYTAYSASGMSWTEFGAEVAAKNAKGGHDEY